MEGHEQEGREASGNRWRPSLPSRFPSPFLAPTAAATITANENRPAPQLRAAAPKRSRRVPEFATSAGRAMTNAHAAASPAHARSRGRNIEDLAGLDLSSDAGAGLYLEEDERREGPEPGAADESLASIDMRDMPPASPEVPSTLLRAAANAPVLPRGGAPMANITNSRVGPERPRRSRSSPPPSPVPPGRAFESSFEFGGCAKRGAADPLARGIGEPQARAGAAQPAAYIDIGVACCFWFRAGVCVGVDAPRNDPKWFGPAVDEPESRSEPKPSVKSPHPRQSPPHGRAARRLISRTSLQRPRAQGRRRARRSGTRARTRGWSG